MPGFGNKSYIQFAAESGYAVGGATATDKLEVISMNVDPVIGVIPDPSLYNAQSRRALYQGGLYYKGQFLVRTNYEGLNELLRAVTGLYSGGVVGGETVVFDHIFKEGQTLKTYRIQMVEGDVPTTKCQVLVGAKVTDLTIKGKAGTGADAMLTCQFNVVARDKLDNQSLVGSPAFPATLPVIFHQSVTLNDGMADTVPGLALCTMSCAVASPTVTSISPVTGFGTWTPASLNLKPGMVFFAAG